MAGASRHLGTAPLNKNHAISDVQKKKSMPWMKLETWIVVLTSCRKAAIGARLVVCNSFVSILVLFSNALMQSETCMFIDHFRKTG